MKVRKSIFSIAFIFIYFLFFYPAGADTMKELKDKIAELNTIIKEKNFFVINESVLAEDQFDKAFEMDTKSILQFRLKLFYSFGKMYGYAIFLNKENDYAIIDNAKLKLTIYDPAFSANENVFFIDVKKESFRKLTLSRGDQVIAFPIEHIKIGNFKLKNDSIPVDAECFHLKTSTTIIPFE